VSEGSENPDIAAMSLDSDIYGQDDDYDGTYDPDWSCQTCGGEGFEWCEDTDSSEGCWEPDCNGRVHTCPYCRCSGARKDQWYW
jgi:hypothetical protein